MNQLLTNAHEVEEHSQGNTPFRSQKNFDSVEQSPKANQELNTFLNSDLPDQELGISPIFCAT